MSLKSDHVISKRDVWASLDEIEHRIKFRTSIGSGCHSSFTRVHQKIGNQNIDHFDHSERSWGRGAYNFSHFREKNLKLSGGSGTTVVEL